MIHFDVLEKHEEILKENEECFRVLEWINEMNSKPLILESIDTYGQSHQEHMINEMSELVKDNKELKKQYDASKSALDSAISLNKKLRKQLDAYSNKENVSGSSHSPGLDKKAIDLEAIKKENKGLEERLEKLQSQNKRKIKEYLESLEEPVDLDQLGKSFRGLTEEYKDAIKQFHEEKKTLIQDINAQNDEYALLIKDNFRQKKKKLEMKNEIEALNNLIQNNSKLKDDIQKANDDFSKIIDKDMASLNDDMKENQELLDTQNGEISELKKDHVKCTIKIENLKQELINLDTSKEYKKLEDALEQLENAHDERVQAGVEKAEETKVSGGHGEFVVEIEETVGAGFRSQRDKEIEDLQKLIRKAEDEIIDMLDFQMQVEQNKNSIKRKTALSESLTQDIEELKKKVDNIKLELQDLFIEHEDAENEREEKETKVVGQETLLRQLETTLRDLRNRLQSYQGLTIEGFTDAEILELREILDKINKKIESYKNKQRKEDEYFAIRKNELLDKEKYIIELRKKLRDLGPEDHLLARPDNVHIDVVDELDKMMLDYIRKWNCNVPITRMGSGYYLFGTRKIYAKILNGKLVIRVGGGYMIITEFLDQYSEVELNKIDRLMEKEKVSRYEDISIVIQHLKPIWDEKERSLKRRKKSNPRVVSSIQGPPMTKLS
jgi:DNA repair exonuclease SbcCD ATPase subunit